MFSKWGKFAKVNTGFSTAGVIEQVRLHQGIVQFVFNSRSDSVFTEVAPDLAVNEFIYRGRC